MKLFELKHTPGSEEVDPIVTETIDKSLILYAEHDFNASTFCARVTASTRSDIYSAITSGIGTLRGNLHGGANEAAMEFLHQFDSVEGADAKLRDVFARKELIMGFGHRVYKNGDPRNEIIKVSKIFPCYSKCCISNYRSAPESFPNLKPLNTPIQTFTRSPNILKV